MHKDAAYWIQTLGLHRHPEGGCFREVYRSADKLTAKSLPERFGGSLVMSTGIYFLLESHEVSSLHRIKSDELWHFYAGSSLTIFVLEPSGRRYDLKLGNRPEARESFQAVVPAGCWFGAKVNETLSFTLAGCTVAPGFDFDDFELADRADLLSRYPQHADLITTLTPSR
jgi:predicted cupin superfamily sugar epimerase